MVKQISSMSRKNVETVYDAVPVESLVEHTCKLVETNCPKQVRLRQELELHGENVLGNSTQLQQVLLNICINGIHAIGVGAGSLTPAGKKLSPGGTGGPDPRGKNLGRLAELCLRQCHGHRLRHG